MYVHAFGLALVIIKKKVILQSVLKFIIFFWLEFPRFHISVAFVKRISDLGQSIFHATKVSVSILFVLQKKR